MPPSTTHPSFGPNQSVGQSKPEVSLNTKTATGFSVSLVYAKQYKGKMLSDDEGWKNTKGECATGVQYVFYKAKNPIGKTSTWKRGILVKGNNIAPGTAIASFDSDGKYANDHAAILVEETKEGLVVWDQFNNPKKIWATRTLKFSKNNTDRSNNGNLFYVIVK